MCILLKYKQIHSSLLHFKPETTGKGALLPSEQTIHILIEKKTVEFKSIRQQIKGKQTNPARICIAIKKNKPQTNTKPQTIKNQKTKTPPQNQAIKAQKKPLRLWLKELHRHKVKQVKQP